MAHKVYLIGLFDDYMTYYMLDQAEWDKLANTRRSLGDMEWTPLTIPELCLDPSEYTEWVNDGSPLDELENDFSLDQILELVKTGKIEVLGTAEGLQL